MYVFLDTETTGFNPNEGSLLEVGIYVCSDNFEPIDSFCKQVHYIPFTNGNVKDEIDDFVFKMHTKNKLWQDTANSYLDLIRCEDAAVRFLVDGGYDNQPMAGSTISFDRGWLHAHMPRLNEAFHYRNIDVSSFREVLPRFGIEAPAKRGAHRALADAKESARNLQYYLTKLGFFDE